MNTRFDIHRWLRPCAAAFTLLAAGAAPPLAQADGKRLAMPAPLPAYQQECGACHLAYPPGLLPAASWQRVMANLAQHYGSNASLDDPATAQAIGAWLNANAATGGKVARELPPQDRITRAGWFVREHRDLDASVWQRPSVKSASQCGACHGGAAQGRFDEHDVRVPRS